MNVRTPAVAGQFYPESETECLEEVEACLEAVSAKAEGSGAELRAAVDAGREEILGGIVPHAGWICSGPVAAEVLELVSRKGGIETFVVFGAAHRMGSTRAALYGEGTWSTPLGDVEIDQDLASAVLSSGSEIVDSSEPHVIEHSIEVQVPFIQHLAPGAKLLPILVPHKAPGPAIGMAVAEQARILQRRVVFVGSTDLTHYGPRYGFIPQGTGVTALDWAKDVNDRSMIDLVCRMEADKVARHAHQHHNACGAGAVAATIAACRRWGATRGVLLRHTTSREMLAGRFGEMSDAVGYAGLVFARPVKATR